MPWIYLKPLQGLPGTPEYDSASYLSIMLFFFLGIVFVLSGLATGAVFWPPIIIGIFLFAYAGVLVFVRECDERQIEDFKEAVDYNPPGRNWYGEDYTPPGDRFARTSGARFYNKEWEG